jgi:DNA-binding MarR family transcriptional regulator
MRKKSFGEALMAIFFNSGRGHEPTSVGAFADDDVIAVLLAYERRARSFRSEIFDDNIINDSSWPLLQDLFAAYLAGAKLRTKQLCATSGLPQTTVIRYLDHLEKFDVIRREHDAEDQRVTLVGVTEAGAFWMREYYTQVIKAERALAERDDGVFTLRDSASQKTPYP